MKCGCNRELPKLYQGQISWAFPMNLPKGLTGDLSTLNLAYGSKPLPGTMSTQICAAIQCHYATMCQTMKSAGIVLYLIVLLFCNLKTWKVFISHKKTLYQKELSTTPNTPRYLTMYKLLGYALAMALAQDCDKRNNNGVTIPGVRRQCNGSHWGDIGSTPVNTLKPELNGRQFVSNILWISAKENLNVDWIITERCS